MDEYVRIMAVNQLKWLNTKKNDVDNLSEEAIRQKKWLSEHNLSTKHSHLTRSKANINGSKDVLEKPVKQTRVSKLSSTKGSSS